MADERFSFRWGIPWLDAGFVQVPDFFFRTYVGLGVTRVEFLFILHLARYKYESVRGQSRPSLGTIGREMGISRRHAARLRSSLEKKAFLIVTERRGRPSVYDFGNFALAALRLARKQDENVTPDTQVMGTHDTQVIPPMTPMSSEEHETSKEDNNNTAVVVSSPSAGKERAWAGLVGLGLAEGIAEELTGKYSADRITSVVEAAVENDQVRNKGAWVATALRNGYKLPEDRAEAERKDKLRKRARNCAFARKPAMGKCPTEQNRAWLAPWCKACPRGEMLMVG